MKFIVSDKVFEKCNNMCFGIVIAKGINNRIENKEINRILDESIELIEEKFENEKVKEAKEILPYRVAFKEFGMNPNKFMNSIEALASRIAKKKGLPKINSIVDLGNAVSLKYLVPLGAHDLDCTNEDICVRFSKDGDQFVPFGQKKAEILEDGEIIYAVGDTVKTRRWIWRQSENGKITEESKNIFFPIDGFIDKNYDSVMKARDELADLVKTIFDCEVKVGFIDKNNREIEI